MTTVKLWQGTAIPRLGMGCWAIGGPFKRGDQEIGWGKVDDAVSIAAIRRAVDLGIRYFDTADVYGASHSEKVLAEALAGMDEEIFISTKFGNTFDATARRLTGTGDTPDYIRSAIDGSLRRLHKERLDLVFFHLRDHPMERSAPVFETLADLRAEGKIAAFGWSTDDVQRAEAFADMDGFVSVQHDMNLLHPSSARAPTSPASEMIRLVAAKNLVAVARQPLAMGLLTGGFRMNEQRFAADDLRADGPEWLSYFVNGRPNPNLLAKVEAVRELLSTDGRTVAQGALAWIWAKSPLVVPIPGFRNVRQVEENAGGLDKGPLSADVMAEIDRVMAVKVGA